MPETNSSRAADNLESLEFSVTVTNRDNNIQQTKKGKSGDSFSFDLDTGFYNVKVSASAKTEPDTIIYEGEKNNVEVKSGKTTNVSMTLKRLKQTWTLDLSETIPYTRLDYNEWGSQNSMYQSEDIEITSLFKGNLPKAGDTLHIIWKGKSEKDIAKLHVIIPNIDIIGKPDEWFRWTQLLSDETMLTPVATDIKAGEEFTIDVNVTLEKTAEHNVHFYFSCGENDTQGSVILYNTETLPDLTPVTLSIEETVLKISKPGNEYVEGLKRKGVDGYIAGIVTGTDENGNNKWLCSRLLHLSDNDAFEDIDFTLDLVSCESEIVNGKISAILDFYYHTDLPDMDWRAQVKAPEVDYFPNPDLRPPVLKIEGNTIVFHQTPGAAYISRLQQIGCNGYCIGIRLNGEWLFGRDVLLENVNEAWMTVDLADDFVYHSLEINGQQISTTIHFYKGVENPDTRKFLFGIDGVEETYTTNEFFLSPSQAINFIPNITGSTSLIIGGTATEEQLTQIGQALKNFSDSISIDLNMTWVSDVTTIPYESFAYVNCLHSIILPDGLTEIANRAFIGCGQLVTVNMPDSLVSIGEYALCDCGSLESINIPESLADIGEAAFGRSCNLSEITVHQSNKNFKVESNVLFTADGTTLIRYPSQLTAESYTVPGDVQNIATDAFSDSQKLKTIILQEGVTSIGITAFAWSPQLQTINIPASVTTIDGAPFRFCDNLETITVDSGNSYFGLWDGALCEIDGDGQPLSIIQYPPKKGGTVYTIPVSVKTIKESAFNDATNLNNIIIGSSVETIEFWGFYGLNQISSMTIPASVKEIGFGVFDESGITSLTFENTQNWYYWNNSERTPIDPDTLGNIDNFKDSGPYRNGIFLYTE